MAIIAKHIPSGTEYLLIGVDSGGKKGISPTRLLRNLLSEEEAAAVEQVALCDRNGRIFWLPAAEIVVSEIDGKLPAEILPEIVTTTSEVLPEAEGTADAALEEDEDWI
jgi:hypothetical protein